MKKTAAIIVSILCSAAAAQAQMQDLDSLVMAFPDEYIDTVQIRKPDELNDYSMIGVNYGASFSKMMFNPAKHGSSWRFAPNYVSVMYTHYEKMFGYFPYFGYQLGVAYGHEGFLFEPGNYTGTLPTVDGVTDCEMSVVEIPFLAQMHFDFAFSKIIVNLGIYGGYRTSISRSGPHVEEGFASAFHDYEYRWDYGIQGGGGYALVFDPFEIQFCVLARYAWQSMYQPDYYSPYYYRYANPLDIMATVGIHFHLTKRYGKTNSMIRREAREAVYGK